MKMKTHLILDAMGVVFIHEDDLEDLLIPYLTARFNHIDTEKLRDLYYNQASLGILSSKEFFKRLNVPDIKQEYLDECLRINPDFLEVAREICKLYTLSMCSNDVSEWASYLRRTYRLDRFFRTYVISGDLGLRKPNPKIYVKLLEALEASGEECILVDNSLRNLEPASKLHITTIHFERSQSRGTYRPDYVVRDFFELERLLPRI